MTTGPIRVPKEQLEDWKVRLLNVCLATKKRGYSIGCNPLDQAFMEDMLAEMHESEAWKNRFEEPIVLVVHRGITPGTLRPVEDAEKHARVISLEEAMGSRSGFGRWQGVQLPQNGEVSDPFHYKRGGARMAVKPKPGNGKKRRPKRRKKR